MQRDNNPLAFFTARRVWITTVILLAQAAVFYGLPKERPVQLASPLSTLPTTFGDWRMVREFTLEQRVLDVLKADDTLERSYADASGHRAVNFYVAFFKSQSTGVAPHSPKNCLPGSGWVASKADSVEFSVPGFPKPVAVNRYIVSKGDARSLVLYWYQSHNRTIPNEYWAKIWLVLDSMRYHRSDTCIMRVTVPLVNQSDEAAQAAAIDFIQHSLKPINDMLPQ